MSNIPDPGFDDCAVCEAAPAVTTRPCCGARNCRDCARRFTCAICGA